MISRAYIIQYKFGVKTKRACTLLRAESAVVKHKCSLHGNGDFLKTLKQLKNKVSLKKFNKNTFLQ